MRGPPLAGDHDHRPGNLPSAISFLSIVLMRESRSPDMPACSGVAVARGWSSRAVAELTAVRLDHPAASAGRTSEAAVAGSVDQCPKLRVERTQGGHAVMAESGPFVQAESAADRLRSREAGGNSTPGALGDSLD
jgi:hypothetical protein